MTRRDEDAELANIVRAHGEATHRLARLQSTAERYAKAFREVSDALASASRLKPAELADDPHSAFMTDLLITANAHISTPPEELEPPPPGEDLPSYTLDELVDFDEAQALIGDIHTAVNVLADTREKLRKFGV